MKLVIKKSEWMEDWYLIERAEHDGRSWIEQTGPNVAALRCSSRIGDADVEGTREEMLAIAAGIERREDVVFRRCAVMFSAGGVRFLSPRNTVDAGELCTLAEADELAGLIRGMAEG